MCSMIIMLVEYTILSQRNIGNNLKGGISIEYTLWQQIFVFHYLKVNMGPPRYSNNIGQDNSSTIRSIGRHCISFLKNY